MPVKSMLHPTLASKIRTQHERIENNVAGFISWSRLESLMVNGGEISRRETVEAFVITDDGLQFFVGDR